MSNQMVTADRLDFQKGVQSEPLSDRDIQMIHRYLSDPTVFPREFKKWVTEHSSDTVDIAKTQVHGLVGESGQVVIGGASMEMMGAALCGCIFPYAAAIQPPGWLLCDGREVLKADYKTLGELLGNAWGAPSAGDRFKLPDLRGRTLFGMSGETPFTGNEGANVGSRGPRHYHRVYDSRAISASGTMSGSGATGEDASNHSHGQPGGGYGVDGGSSATALIIEGGGWPPTYGINDSHWHYVTSVTVSGSVAGTHTIDVNTYDDPGPLKGTVGWVGINWIIGTGKLPT